MPLTQKFNIGGGVKYTEVGKLVIFNRNRRLSPKLVQDRPMVAMDH